MKLNITPEDDPAFVQIVSRIIDSVIAERTLQIVAVIQIDNWFDHKWLHFTGKVLGALGVWKDELTIPPFNPHRVKSQMVSRLTDRGIYESFEAPPLHIEQWSSDNLNRKLKNSTDSGVFVWWTSNTVTNGKGSVMVYTQKSDESSAWFVSFEREAEWKIRKTKDISVEEVRQFMKSVEQGTGVDA